MQKGTHGFTSKKVYKRPHKTAKRLAIKHAMLAEKAAKKR